MVLVVGDVIACAVLLVLLVLQPWVRARGRSEEVTTSTGRRARAWGVGRRSS